MNSFVWEILQNAFDRVQKSKKARNIKYGEMKAVQIFHDEVKLSSLDLLQQKLSTNNSSHKVDQITKSEDNDNTSRK